MIIEVDGVQYTNFTKASCKLRLDSLSSFFSFTAAADGPDRLPLRTGQECKVYVDDELVLTGHIESMLVDYTTGKHSITYAGRDKTADILDSTLGAIDNIEGQELTMKAAIQRVISHLGLDVKVIDQVQPKLFKQDEDLLNPEIGDNAFEFIERIARKRQVLLTSDQYGNLVLARNDGTRADGVIQHVIDSEDNNVLAATFAKNTSERFRLYKVASGLNIAAIADIGGDVEVLTDQQGDIEDGDIRKGRQMVVISETPSGSDTKERAIWEADVRKARSTTYDCTVAGYRVGIDSGDIWRTNRLYAINDDFIGLDKPMLCNAVTFNLDEDGRRTDLELIGRDAYRLQLSPDLDTLGVLLSDANPDTQVVSFGVLLSDAD
mgnify:CR=1 FL=1